LCLTIASAYGNRGKDLTQEQKASLETLIKGVNGYQASLDGATNTGQAEKEGWQQSSQLHDSNSPLSSFSPSQLADLLGLIKMYQDENRPNQPSTTAIGSQVGQTASQASWMVPGESTLQEAGYTGASSGAMVKDTVMNGPDTQSLVLIARLQELRKQEQEVLGKLQGPKLLQQLGARQISYETQSRPEQRPDLHNMSEEELDDVTSMILSEQAKARSTTAVTSSTSLPVTLPSTNAMPTTTPEHIPTNVAHQLRQTLKREKGDRAESPPAMTLHELGDFDSDKQAAAALSVPHVKSASTSAMAKSKDQSALSILLDELDPSLRQEVLQHWRSGPKQNTFESIPVQVP